MDGILSNGTWELIDRPHSCKHVGCKWVFKKKLRPDGTINKYETRLVGKGYTQNKDKDFFDTYSPVTSLTIICVLLSLAPHMVFSFIRWMLEHLQETLINSP
jgi:hypothetical protein